MAFFSSWFRPKAKEATPIVGAPEASLTPASKRSPVIEEKQPGLAVIKPQAPPKAK